jgi:uncharacterized RDD family membrane protein YckC
MATGCPNCGWQTVEGPRCPRCGVNIAEYRAQLAVASAVAPPPGPSISQTAPPRPETAGVGAPPSPTIHPAGFWIRFVARVIDGVLLLLVVAVVPLLGALVSVAYEIFFHWRWGQTLGKMAMRIRVVTMAGPALSIGDSVLRWFGTLVSGVLLCMGYVLAAFRADKRALHDLMAGTRVEYVP